MSPIPSKGSGLKWDTQHNLADDMTHLAWKFAITTFLEAEDLIDMVNGNWEMPRKRHYASTETNRYRDELKRWELDNAKSKALLFYSVSKGIMINIGGLPTAAEVWKYLNDTYNSKSWGTWATVRDDFNHLKYQDGTSMQEHISLVNRASDKLSSVSETPVTDREKGVVLLSSLPSDWSNFKAPYYFLKHPCSWSQLTANCIAEYSRRLHEANALKRQDQSLQSAMVAHEAYNPAPDRFDRIEALIAKAIKRHPSDSVHSSSQKGCRYCASSSHETNQCSLRDSHFQERRKVSIANGYQPRSAPTAQFATKHDEEINALITSLPSPETQYLSDSSTSLDHPYWALSTNVTDLCSSESSSEDELVEMDCLTPYGKVCYMVVPKHQHHFNAVITGTVLSASIVPQNKRNLYDHVWVLDSGASHFICRNREDFKSFRPLTGQLKIADGNHLPIEGRGDVSIRVRHNKAWHHLNFSDVLYVPTCGRNLFSIGQAAQRGVQFDFHTKPGVVIMRFGALELMSESSDGLYTITHCPRPDKSAVTDTLNTRISAYSVCATNSYYLWHKRLGHASPSSLSSLQELVTGMKLDTASPIDWFCDACQLGTKNRTNVLRYPPAPKQLNSVTFSDLAGPIEVAGLSGGRYVLIFVDSLSRFVHLFIIKAKSDFLPCFIQHKTRVETKQNTPLQAINSDGGGEYISTALNEFCRAHGIDQRRTVRHTPEQNVLAEVRFKTLFGRARTALIDSGLPKQLWEQAVKTMVHTMNVGKVRGATATTYELWHGHKPDISGFRTFGCLYYA